MGGCSCRPCTHLESRPRRHDHNAGRSSRGRVVSASTAAAAGRGGRSISRQHKRPRPRPGSCRRGCIAAGRASGGVGRWAGGGGRGRAAHDERAGQVLVARVRLDTPRWGGDPAVVVRRNVGLEEEQAAAAAAGRCQWAGSSFRQVRQGLLSASWHGGILAWPPPLPPCHTNPPTHRAGPPEWSERRRKPSSSSSAGRTTRGDQGHFDARGAHRITIRGD